MIEKELIKINNQLWYYKTYNQLIEKCQEMEVIGYPDDVYTEVHHIYPKCLGGDNSRINLVRMPIRYHIMAHLLLVEMYPKNLKIIYAANLMVSTSTSSTNYVRDKERLFSVQKHFSTKTIARIKELNIFARRGENSPNFGKPCSKETKQKISEANKGRIVSKETREKISKAGLGRKHSEESKRKMSKTRKEKGTWNKGKKLSEEERLKMSEVRKGKNYMTEENKRKLIEINTGKPRSPETRRKISEAHKGEKNHMWGKSVDISTRKKISDALKQKKIIPINSKKTQDPKGVIYQSIEQCAKANGIAKTTLRRWIIEHPEKGYKFVD